MHQDRQYVVLVPEIFQIILESRWIYMNPCSCDQACHILLEAIVVHPDVCPQPLRSGCFTPEGAPCGMPVLYAAATAFEVKLPFLNQLRSRFRYLPCASSSPLVSRIMASRKRNSLHSCLFYHITRKFCFFFVFFLSKLTFSDSSVLFLPPEPIQCQMVPNCHSFFTSALF